MKPLTSSEPIGAFAITKLNDVEWNDSIIKSLVMSPEWKDFISDLVQSHTTKGGKGTARFDDFVRDKGKGLVGLLASPPWRWQDTYS